MVSSRFFNGQRWQVFTFQRGQVKSANKRYESDSATKGYVECQMMSDVQESKKKKKNNVFFADEKCGKAWE